MPAPISKPPANVILCSPAHLVYLAQQMRQDERDQYVAMTCADEYRPDVAARGFINTSATGYAFTVLMRSGMPAMAGGYEEVLPGVWQSWMVGTEQGWAEQWRSATKATRWLMNGLFLSGARRLQTISLASRKHAIEWFERSLLLRPEGLWRCYGRDGEDVSAFALTRTEWEDIRDGR